MKPKTKDESNTKIEEIQITDIIKQASDIMQEYHTHCKTHVLVPENWVEMVLGENIETTE